MHVIMLLYSTPGVCYSFSGFVQEKFEDIKGVMRRTDNTVAK